jgi:hypothetical protein
VSELNTECSRKGGGFATDVEALLLQVALSKGGMKRPRLFRIYAGGAKPHVVVKAMKFHVRALDAAVRGGNQREK